MSSKKRVFSTNDIVNYKDVYVFKNGTEILKTIKREDNIAIIDRFNSYHQLHTLNSAYYPFLDNNVFIEENVTNLYEANGSFIDHSGYKPSCNPCKPCNPNPCNPNPCNPCKPCNPNPCNPNPCDKHLLKGNILKKKQVIPYSNSSATLHVCKWNNAKCVKPGNPYGWCHCTKPRDECNCSSNCGCSLCKNAKPLFI